MHIYKLLKSQYSNNKLIQFTEPDAETSEEKHEVNH